MRVLVVSYHCLDGTAEGLASARVARALAGRGHAVDLLTSARGRQDETLAGVAVHRLEPEPPRAADRAGAWLDRRRGRVWSRIAAVPHLLRGCTVEERGWVRAVLRREADLRLEGARFDVIHSRLNPAVSHLAALALQRRRGLPWCAYFSDPWPHHLYPEPYRFTVGPLSRRRLEGVLDTVLARAGSLVFPSERLRDWMLGGRRERHRERAWVAPHVGEEESGGGEDDGVLRLRHAGFLMKERRVDALLAGAERFLAARPEARDALRIELAGRYAGGEPPAVPEALAGVVSFAPAMPPGEARRWMAAASVSLLVEARMEEGIFFPSKLSDYLAARRPILALSPARGVAADLLAAGGGLVADPGDPEAIAAALERLYGLWRDGRLAELAPGPEQARAVSADTVGCLYEQAFARAVRR